MALQLWHIACSLETTWLWRRLLTPLVQFRSQCLSQCAVLPAAKVMHGCGEAHEYLSCPPQGVISTFAHAWPDPALLMRALSAGAVKYRLKCSLKRYWATKLWNHIFDSLLNHQSLRQPPPCLELAQAICQHLQESPAVSHNIRAALMKLVRCPHICFYKI